VVGKIGKTFEYVCAENERDSIHLVGKKSDDTKNAVKVPLEILTST
jgi:hypothetical protein